MKLPTEREPEIDVASKQAYLNVAMARQFCSAPVSMQSWSEFFQCRESV
jgi:hypothetical protein